MERYEGHFLNWYDTRTLARAAAALCLDRRQRQSRRSSHRRATGRAAAAAGARPVAARLARSGFRDLAVHGGPVETAEDLDQGRSRTRRTAHLRGADPDAVPGSPSHARARGGTVSRGAPAFDPARRHVGDARDDERARVCRRPRRGEARAQRHLESCAGHGPPAAGAGSRMPGRRRTAGHGQPDRHPRVPPCGAEPFAAAGNDVDAARHRAARAGIRHRTHAPHARRSAPRSPRSVTHWSPTPASDSSTTRAADCSRSAIASPMRALDDSYYDLLASEARLASLVAIAKTEVPRSHWFRLGRRLTGGSRRPMLASWSGSMFEYLMPSLVMNEPRNSLLGQIGAPRGAPADQLRRGTSRSLGRIGVGVQRARPRDDLPVFRLRTARPRSQAGPGRRSRRRALCDGTGRDDRAGRGGRELPCAERARRARHLRLPRGDRFHAAAAAEGRQRSGHLRLHGPSPGHGPRRTGQYAAWAQHAGPLPCRSDDPGGGAAAAGARDPVCRRAADDRVGSAGFADRRRSFPCPSAGSWA